MPHALEIGADGAARFAYNLEGGVPWHRLGTALDGLQTADAMLAAAGADFRVELAHVLASAPDGTPLTNADGSPIRVKQSRVAVRVNADGSRSGLATVGERYTVLQNRECLDYALEIVGASNGDAVMDTAGVLHEGRRFFATIDLGPLVIDPAGVDDRLARYLLVYTSHDGSVALTFANTAVRAVCQNTVYAGLRRAKSIFKARHTPNSERQIKELAAHVLGISATWARAFMAMAEELLRLEVPSSSHLLDAALDHAFPLASSASEAQRANHARVIELVRNLYLAPTNAGGFGENAWSLLNAVGEYFDHVRDIGYENRALSSMNPSSLATRTKISLQRFLTEAASAA